MLTLLLMAAAIPPEKHENIISDPGDVNPKRPDRTSIDVVLVEEQMHCIDLAEASNRYEPKLLMLAHSPPCSIPGCIGVAISRPVVQLMPKRSNCDPVEVDLDISVCSNHEIHDPGFFVSKKQWRSLQDVIREKKWPPACWHRTTMRFQPLSHKDGS